MNKQQLEVKTVKELMVIAGEEKIVGRHNMKKEQLIEAILEVKKVEEKVEEKVEVTNKEKQMLNGIRENEYNDGLEGPTWTFTAIENSGLPQKSSGGVISSLIKKGLVFVSNGYFEEEESTIVITDKGKKLFEEATGAECSWGGFKLLEVEEEEEVVEPEKTEEQKSSRGSSGKGVQILENGKVIIEFEKTYEASRWLSEKFEVKYSTVDRYLVGQLKGKEVKVPKQLVGTEFENLEFRR